MPQTTPLQPAAPQSKDTRIHWQGLLGSSASLAVSNLALQENRLLILITPHIHASNQLKRELDFFSATQNLPLYHFPDWETLPYDHFSPHEDLISERLLTLFKLSSLKKGIVIVALPSLMHRLPPKSYLQAYTFALACSETLDLKQFRKQLTNAGYRHVDQVIEHGEYALRGSIIDIYPMGSSLPYRIELFDDDVETIRSFDPDTQLSIEKVDRIHLLPAREYPLTPDSIKQFRTQWRTRFPGNPNESSLYQHISAAEPAAGIEYYLPLFFSETQTFFDYLPENSLLVFTDDPSKAAKLFWDEIKQRYEQLRYDTTRPLCPPQDIFTPVDQNFSAMNAFTQIYIDEESRKEGKGVFNFHTEAPPNLFIDHKAKNPFQLLQTYLENITISSLQRTSTTSSLRKAKRQNNLESSKHPKSLPPTHDNKKRRLLFCAETTGRREVLLNLLKEIEIHPKIFETWHDFLENDTSIGMTVASLDAGLVLTDPSIALITESQLFGEQVMQRRLRKHREQDPELLIRNLTELNIGAPVVHIEYGVGRYQGLRCIKTGEIEAEYLTLEYANDDKIYVPVSALHLISRYTGIDAEHAPLQKLGSQQWNRVKERTLKQVRDVAAELLEIYSRRKATPGFAFPKTNKDYQLFINAFPFEETPDQQLAIETVINDMETKQSMDRLVCGDVGFGKTEVAMRAAFIAAQAGKQVVVLVPTTLLANQHLQTFQDRFADWPIKIAVLSRLRTKKEQDETIRNLANGQIDIVIGTHKLLNKEIKYKDLGLLVVDEEHRFGVRQKERIKSLRAHIDILTLTATPIPRTLNMALAGTRDLSIIATPPARRLSIKTFLYERNSGIIREAILREAMRGGQVYFLHNEVATIHAQAEKLKDIVPEAKIGIAHGQMRERELENVMSGFYHQKFNVLLCTTIIESGIDIPTANTIIINRADRFGLAQLHQLRGRVGRSHHQAYAYLLTPHSKSLTRDAKKRLDALTSLEDLGAGFNLASHDLEIRGAGELLGEEQSGHIQAIGFSLYMELLEEAVKALKSGEEPDFYPSFHAGTEIDLHISALIPESYVSDVHARLTLYKRLSSCKQKGDIQNLLAEMVDRFGTLPEVTKYLLEITELKLAASKLGIQKIDAGRTYAYLHFEEKPQIDPDRIVHLIQKYPKQYRLEGATQLRFTLPSAKEPAERIAALWKVLKVLK